MESNPTLGGYSFCACGEPIPKNNLQCTKCRKAGKDILELDLGGDARVEEIRATSYVDGLEDAVANHKKLYASDKAEIDQLKERLKDAEEYGQEYIERTDPALQCDYWWRYDDGRLEPGEQCGRCRRCALEEVDRLKVDYELLEVNAQTFTEEIEDKLKPEILRLKVELQRWQRIRKPTHGSCCTCQRCGQYYDDCRCDLDEVADEVAHLKAVLDARNAGQVEAEKQIDELQAELAEARSLPLEIENDIRKAERQQIVASINSMPRVGDGETIRAVIAAIEEPAL